MLIARRPEENYGRAGEETVNNLDELDNMEWDQTVELNL